MSRRLAVGPLALALLVPGVALASHQFSDVPTTNTFHDHIDWLSDYEITAGCGGDKFCPSAAVSRGQMAAFMHRLSNEFELVSETVDPPNNDFYAWVVDCPDDKRAIAGGGRVNLGSTFMTYSTPTAAGGGWTVEFETDNDVVADPSILTVWALCAPRL